MFIHFRSFLCFLLLIWTSALFSQNETAKWYFGNYAGLDFMTNPPTVLTNGSLISPEGCASISDAAGNLLFYTDGMKVFNKSHAVMANGNGLYGFNSFSQSAIIVKQPGKADIYYIFTPSSFWGPNYSVVDMSLAAGMGSVTVKNTTLASVGCTEKLTAVKHCNGTDVWMIHHDWGSANFRSYLLTAAGVNTAAVISTIGTIHTGGQNYMGCMKTSPNGKKLALALFDGLFELFDFDNTTGVVSNSLSLNSSPIPKAYGCEFSPDGTKLYGSCGPNVPGCKLFQWDLCAGSPTAIAASIYNVAPTNTIGIGSLQRASDGKIYGALRQTSHLIVVNAPNLYGAACNYVQYGLSIAPKSDDMGLPNFITSTYRPPAGPFTHTVNCNTTSFSLPASVPGSTMAGCQSMGYSLTNVLWNFGDPASGSANTSTSNMPSHAFTAPGTYTTELILYYSCGGGTDTLRQSVTILQAGPSLSISGAFTVCPGETQTYTVTGASSYSWNTGAFTSALSIGPAVSTATYHVIGTATKGCTSTKTFTVTVNTTPSLSILGAFTVCPGEMRTYTVTGASSYSWNTGALTSTLSIGPAASTATYNVAGTTTNGCSSTKTFTVTVNTAPSLSLSGTFTVCPGEKRIYTASGASSYSWNTGSAIPSITVTPSSSFTYTVTGTDINGCSSQKTLAVTVNKCTSLSETIAVSPRSVTFYPNPVNTYLQLEATEKAEILLFDLQGRLVLKKELEPGLQQLDLSHLNNGVYSIRAVTAGESSTKRLVKLSD